MDPAFESVENLRDAHKGSPALVMGNGESRLTACLDDTPEGFVTFGCNGMYRDPFKVDYLSSVDVNMTTEIIESGWHETRKMISPKARQRQWKQHIDGSKNVVIHWESSGWSSGPLLTEVACIFGCDPIYLLGFDMAWTETSKINNVYKDSPNYRPGTADPTYSGNWEKQFSNLFNSRFPDRMFYQIGPGVLPDKDADPVRYISWEDMLSHFEAPA